MPSMLLEHIKKNKPIGTFQIIPSFVIHETHSPDNTLMVTQWNTVAWKDEHTIPNMGRTQV